MIDLHDSYEVFVNESDLKNDEFEYFFTTDSNIVYILGFSNASYLFRTECLVCSNIFSFTFYPSEQKGQYDPKIKLTIIKTIHRFIELYRCPVIYVCDTSSSGGRGRLRLFSSWFNEYSKGLFLHDQRIFETDYQQIPLGIIAAVSDSNFNQYLNEIDSAWMG